MFSNSNLTIRFLIGGVVVALLLLLAVGGGTGFIAVLYLNNEITSLSSEFGALSGAGRDHALQIYHQAQAAFSYFLMALRRDSIFRHRRLPDDLFRRPKRNHGTVGCHRPCDAAGRRPEVRHRHSRLGRANEIGLLAAALEVFKTTGIERQRLSEHELQEAQRQGERSAISTTRFAISTAWSPMW